MHQPEVEQALGHLMTVHHCSTAIALRDEIANAVARQRRDVTLIPASGSVQVDITAEVAEALAERLDEFRALHDAHHSDEIVAAAIEKWDEIRDREGT